MAQAEPTPREVAEAVHRILIAQGFIQVDPNAQAAAAPEITAEDVLAIADEPDVESAIGLAFTTFGEYGLGPDEAEQFLIEEGVLEPS